MYETEATEGLAATLDLGSNSFHLLVARFDAGGWQPHSRLGEKVQLAAGMVDDMLTRAAMERGWRCLQRFAPCLRDLPAGRVSVVGTQALRVAKNRDRFLRDAATILGHPVDVISGLDEARLIYRGVAGGYAPTNHSAQQSQQQLVVDVGGGSTELVLGLGDRIQAAVSVPVGCLTLRRQFTAGRLDAAAFGRVCGAARTMFSDHWFSEHWPRPPASLPVLGCSGTLLAIEQVLGRAGWSRHGIDRAGLASLQKALLGGFEHIDAVRFDGLSENRRSVFVAGAAVVIALFDALGIERMALSRAALREGLMEQLWHDTWLATRCAQTGGNADVPRAHLP